MFRDLVIVIIIIKSFPRYSSRISSPHNIIIPLRRKDRATRLSSSLEKFTRDPSVGLNILFDSFLLFSSVTKTGGRI